MKKRRSSHNRDIIGAAQRGAGGLPRYWGTMMTDSIDLLEAVGRDASLRHLPPDELARRLKAAGASEELAGAVVERSSALLSKEFGTRVTQEPQVGFFPYREEPEAPQEAPTPEEEEGGEGTGNAKQSLPDTSKLN